MLNCKRCGKNVYDNREKKASGQYRPNAPDFACSGCKYVGYLNKDNKVVWQAPKKKVVKESPATTYTPKANAISASYYGAWVTTLAVASVEKKLDQEKLAKAFGYFMTVVENAVNKNTPVAKEVVKKALPEIEDASPEDAATKDSKIDLGGDETLDLGDLDNLDLNL